MGQAIWPTIFDNMKPTKHGFLSLKYQRGIFHYGKESYTLIEASGNDFEIANMEGDDLAMPVIQPRNDFQHTEVDWRVSVSGDTLKVGLGLKGIDKKLAYVTVSPSRALANLSSALVVEDCPHDTDTQLNDPDLFAIYTHPLDPGRPLRVDDIDPGVVAVVPVSGKSDLQLISLACGDYYAPIVLRNEACLSCCLRICRESTYPMLVL
ncbi:uncharacterized protein N7483_010129 [Penicillium malachiteum]|uniref:uncharacterized protein n=1 Tax=Penicillium malachiteum TaxID=1324776 RepID=UPI00254981CB|nr:uncharacterized protein N7483_010129 [Penicillium malachiteum]KAJ5712948.1 hypothetical protein N7483_010129 [Penicillium malachiteum]